MREGQTARIVKTFGVFGSGSKRRFKIRFEVLLKCLPHLADKPNRLHFSMMVVLMVVVVVMVVMEECVCACVCVCVPCVCSLLHCS